MLLLQSFIVYAFDSHFSQDAIHVRFCRSTFIYLRPQTTASSLAIFLRPLEEKVWWCLILSMFTILILLRLTFNTEHRIFKGFCDLFERTWSYLTLFIVATFCQQGN